MTKIMTIKVIKIAMIVMILVTYIGLKILVYIKQNHIYNSSSNLVFSHMIKWFAANNIVLNLRAANIMKFIINNSAYSTLRISFKEKYIEETVNTTFLGN
jgi:hypothetical protein